MAKNITIIKSTDGFGFNVRGQVVEGGQVKAINGRLYAPLQNVTAITKQSSAEKAGLCIGDKILQVYVINFIIYRKIIIENTFFIGMVLMLKVHHIKRSLN